MGLGVTARVRFRVRVWVRVRVSSCVVGLTEHTKRDVPS